jgi:NADH dehydrogenase [ubiquinone] 1 alpha subcomplex assembly factor 7
MERLDAFMARANAHYYATHDPFADFTTAPEISQVFGELLGAWAAVVWDAMGQPDPVILAEAGPGRGTLMADAMRVIDRTAPDFAAALRLHLVEISPRLREEQAARLEVAGFHDRIEDLPDGPLILLANEFLDALPIRQFVRRDAWMERHVADGAFVELAADIALPEAEAGAVMEICEPALDIAGHLGLRLAAKGGAALFIDYGPARSGFGCSLQALRGRAQADPLAEPGEADLTAHVDFAAFAEAARGAEAHGPIPQGVFLTRLGLFQRNGVLARTQPPAKAMAMLDAVRRLAEPDAMGQLFKALALTSPGLPTPPGFVP